MARSRGWGSSVQLREGSWLVVMGEGSYGEMTYTSEIFNISTQTWGSGPEFPLYQSGHCALSLNETHLMLVGGWDSDLCYLYSVEEETFTEIPCLQSGGRHYHSCARTQDGRVAVVGGCPRIDGLSKCSGDFEDYFVELEFFDPTSLTWSYGPRLEKGVLGASLVADGEDLLLLGGMTMEGLVDTIYRLSNGGEWELLETKLNSRQMYFPVIPVDTAIYGC